MHTCRLYAILVLGIALVALASPPPVAAEEESRGTAGPVAADPTPRGSIADEMSVELLDAGKRPRRKLRYAPRAGSSWEITNTMNMEQAIRFGDQVLTSAKMKLVIEATLRIESVKRGRPTGVTIVVNDVSLKAGEGAAMMAAGGADVFAQELDLLDGQRVRAAYDDRGLLVSVEAGALDELPPSLAEVVRVITLLPKTLVTPFPEEAVGPGARWRVTRRGEAMGFSLRESSEYTFVRRSGQTVEATYTSSVSSAEQEVTTLGGMPIPEGSTCLLEAMDTESGGGQTAIHLGGLGGTLQSEGSMTMNISLEVGDIDKRFGCEVRAKTQQAFRRIGTDHAAR